jgi:hypothetical protein
MFRVPEECRITMANLPTASCVAIATAPHAGLFGAFVLHPRAGDPLLCIASDIVPGIPWEHVSVSVPKRTRVPNWREMCHVKDAFWDEEDCVAQFHPPKSDYVNYHPYVLHLWRPVGIELPRPPSIAVGPRARVTA